MVTLNVILMIFTNIFLGCRPIWGDNAYRSSDKTKFDYGLYPYGTKATSSCQGGYENKSGWRVKTPARIQENGQDTLIDVDRKVI